MPFDDGLGVNDDQNFPSVFPESRKNCPEDSVSPVKFRSLDRAVEDGQLLTKDEDFCCQRNSGLEQ